MTAYANKQETFAHLANSFVKFGTATLSVWLTSAGKWIDEQILDELTKDGLVEKLPYNEGNPFSSPVWQLTEAGKREAGKYPALSDTERTIIRTLAFRGGKGTLKHLDDKTTIELSAALSVLRSRNLISGDNFHYALLTDGIAYAVFQGWMIEPDFSMFDFNAHWQPAPRCPHCDNVQPPAINPTGAHAQRCASCKKSLFPLNWDAESWRTVVLFAVGDALEAGEVTLQHVHQKWGFNWLSTFPLKWDVEAWTTVALWAARDQAPATSDGYKARFASTIVAGGITFELTVYDNWTEGAIGNSAHAFMWRDSDYSHYHGFMTADSSDFEGTLWRAWGDSVIEVLETLRRFAQDEAGEVAAPGFMPGARVEWNGVHGVQQGTIRAVREVTYYPIDGTPPTKLPLYTVENERFVADKFANELTLLPFNAPEKPLTYHYPKLPVQVTKSEIDGRLSLWAEDDYCGVIYPGTPGYAWALNLRSGWNVYINSWARCIHYAKPGSWNDHRLSAEFPALKGAHGR